MIGFELIALLLLSSVTQQNSSLLLDGSASSYAKFPKWPSCPNSSLTFEFMTQRPNGLLLYVELQRKSSFVELKLVGGTVSLQFNYGSGAKILSVGEHLHNGRRHVVTLRLDFQVVLLSVDSVVLQMHPIVDLTEQTLVGGYVYVGGLPTTLVNQIDTLALSFVLFETRFQGSISAVFYSQCGNKPTSVRMLEASGLRSTSDDICEEHNPCQNGGECVSTEAGVTCDCWQTEYNGTHCEAGELSILLFTSYLFLKILY